MVNARIKMLWLAFLLALLPRAEILPRAGVAAVLVSFAASSRASRRAIPRMVLLALFGGVLTLLAGQARPPPLFPRAPTPVEVDLIAKSSIWHASVDPSGTFGEPLFGIPPSIPKVLHISKSVWLRAVSVFLATYTTTQSASLLLVTTPPDALARVTAGICILVSRKAAKEMEITLLLAIRFLAVIAAELHSLALGVAAKGIAWRSLGTADGIAICIAVIQRITRNMQLHVKATARAMEARGFTNPWQHQLLQTDDEWGFADGVAIALLIMLASAIFLT